MVIFLLSENDSEEQIIVIKRKNNLRQHAGQIAFPGGKIEKKDKSLMETAFRETQEEINIFKKALIVYLEGNLNNRKSLQDMLFIVK